MQRSLGATDHQQQNTRDWYEAVIISLDALRDFILRYQQTALQLSETVDDEKRAKELKETADLLHHISTQPPKSFHQALQLFWFAHIALDSNLNFLAFGRFDQYMWLFLERDLTEQHLHLEHAQELVDSLWLKCNERYCCGYRKNKEEDLFAGGIVREQNSQQHRCVGVLSRRKMQPGPVTAVAGIRTFNMAANNATVQLNTGRKRRHQPVDLSLSKLPLPTQTPTAQHIRLYVTSS